jgi:hypothetical protein
MEDEEIEGHEDHAAEERDAELNQPDRMTDEGAPPPSEEPATE